jgi:hypothetical protein
VLPYIDAATNNEIKKICEKYKLEGNICFKSIKLYNLTDTQTKRCKIDNILNMKAVVYKMKCNACNGKEVSYIGETGRLLKTKVSEHFTLYKNRSRLSEVGAHCIDVHGQIDRNNWSIFVIHQEIEEFDRKIKESCYINNQNPSLNVSKGAIAVGLERCKFKIINFPFPFSVFGVL